MESLNLTQSKGIRNELTSYCSQCDLSRMTVHQQSCDCERCPKCSQKNLQSIPCVGCQDWFPPVLAGNIEAEYDLYELWLAGSPKKYIEELVETPVKTPMKTSVKTPVKTPVGTSVGTSVETPVEIPMKTPVEELYEDYESYINCSIS